VKNSYLKSGKKKFGYPGYIIKCSKSRDGKHDWERINKFQDKCIFCDEINDIID